MHIALHVADQQIPLAIVVQVGEVRRAVADRRKRSPRIAGEGPIFQFPILRVVVIHIQYQAPVARSHHQIRPLVAVPIEEGRRRAQPHGQLPEAGRCQAEVGLRGAALVAVIDDQAAAIAHEQVLVAVPVDIHRGRNAVVAHVDAREVGRFQPEFRIPRPADIAQEPDLAVASAHQQVQIFVPVDVGEPGGGVFPHHTAEQVVPPDAPGGRLGAADVVQPEQPPAAVAHDEVAIAVAIQIAGGQCHLAQTQRQPTDVEDVTGDLPHVEHGAGVFAGIQSDIIGAAADEHIRHGVVVDFQKGRRRKTPIVDSQETILHEAPIGQKGGALVLIIGDGAVALADEQVGVRIPVPVHQRRHGVAFRGDGGNAPRNRAAGGLFIWQGIARRKAQAVGRPLRRSLVDHQEHLPALISDEQVRRPVAVHIDEKRRQVGTEPTGDETLAHRGEGGEDGVARVAEEQQPPIAGAHEQIHVPIPVDVHQRRGGMAAGVDDDATRLPLAALRRAQGGNVFLDQPPEGPARASVVAKAVDAAVQLAQQHIRIAVAVQVTEGEFGEENGAVIQQRRSPLPATIKLALPAMAQVFLPSAPGGQREPQHAGQQRRNAAENGTANPMAPAEPVRRA